MRVLHIDTGREMRGGQWQVLHLLGGLRYAGVPGTLMAPAGSPLYERARACRFPVVALSPWRLAWMAPRFDLVHAHDARAHSLAALLVRRPIVVARRVAFPVRDGRLSRWKYRRAAKFLAISRFVRERLLEHGVEEARIVVVYDAVPTAPPGTGPRRGILAPATGDAQKGSALLTSTGLEVKFSTNLAEDLPGAEVFVYLSHQEGLGSAILLAMRSGTPVVASRVGGIPELIENEVTGLLVENESAEVVAAVRRLLGDAELSGRLAARARERMMKEFTVPVLVRETLRVYEEVLG